MTAFTTGERALISYALGAYRMRIVERDDSVLAPAGGVEEIDAIQYKLELAAAGELAEVAYQGIGERKKVCFCRTCRIILESQLRDVLARLPDENRHDVVEHVSSALDVDGRAP